MALQINQYAKTRTDLTIQDDDLMDFDSTEDAGTSYESAKITVADFLAYVAANVSSNSIYTADDTITANRTLTANGVYTKWIDGSVIINHVGESSGYGFIIEFSSAERGQLGFNQALQSAFLELQNFDAGPGLSTFFNALDGKVAIGHGTATSTLHVKGEGSTSGTTSFLAQNSIGAEMFKIRDDGKVSINDSSPSGTFSMKALDSQGAILQGDSTGAAGFTLQLKDSTGTIVNLFRNSGRVDLCATASAVANIGGGSGTARVNIFGKGNTSATTNFLAENSSGVDLFHIKDDGVVNMSNLPTSSAGLSSGDIWNNSGVLNIV